MKPARSALSVAVDTFRQARLKPLAEIEGEMLDRLAGSEDVAQVVAESGVDMLDRLGKNEDAAKAFARLALSEAKGLIFVDDCVTAHCIKGMHKAQVEKIYSAPDYNQTLARLESVVKDLGKLTQDEDKAVRTIESGIIDRRRYHEDDLWSTSQKGDDASARSRAIGWLKESVRRLSGRPNYKPLMTLCEVVLNAPGEISLDAVKRADTPGVWLSRRFSHRVRIPGE